MVSHNLAQNSKLAYWLSYFQQQHPKNIDLSLERTKVAAERLHLLPYAIPAVIVAGTNGKGSTVKVLETMYHKAGYKTGSYTSPELFLFNERIKINGAAIDEEAIAESFARIAKFAKDISLTYFEAGTLAALDCFIKNKCDCVILEVGMGGRFDAVNIIDADISIITSIDRDHEEFLGYTREKIAFEKAGIFRTGCPAVIGDHQPPVSLFECAKELSTPLYLIDNDFSYQKMQKCWQWSNLNLTIEDLPYPELYLDNVSCALQAVYLWQKKFPVSLALICTALNTLTLTGRQQLIPGQPIQLYDVAHNPAGVDLLASYLKQNPVTGKNIAVFSMLKDKDIHDCIAKIKNQIDYWFIAKIPDDRGAHVTYLSALLKKNQVNHYKSCETIEQALQQAKLRAKPEDRIIIFGSFHTVASCLKPQKDLSFFSSPCLSL